MSGLCRGLGGSEMNRRIRVKHHLPGPSHQDWHADADIAVFSEYIEITVVTHDGGYLRIKIDRPLIID